MNPIWILVALALVFVAFQVWQALGRRGVWGPRVQHIILLTDYLVEGKTRD